MSDKDSLDDDGKTASAQEPVSAAPVVSDPVCEPVTGPQPEIPGSEPEQTSVVVTAVEARVAAERTYEDRILPTQESGPLNKPPANARRVEDFIVPAAEPNVPAVGELQWFDLPRNRPLTVEVLPASVDVLDFDPVIGAAQPPESRPEKCEITHDALLPVAAHDCVSGAVDAALDNVAPLALSEPDPERAPLLVRLGIDLGAQVVPDAVETLTGAETPTIAAFEPMTASATTEATAQVESTVKSEATAAAMTVAAIVADTAVSNSPIEPVVRPQILPPPPQTRSTPVTEAPLASLSRSPLRERSPDLASAPQPGRTFTQPPVHRVRVQSNAQVTPSARPEEQVEAELPPPEPALATAPPQHWPRRAATFALRAAVAYAALLIGLVVLFRFVDPPGSALIALRWVSGTEIQRSWVPIETISPQLVRAVIVSEDWSFCTHNGIDIEAIEQAIEKAGDGIPRGASTISMQVAKNVFLWPSKSYVRKAIEVPLTLLMEFIWPKRRILEVYLNVAEWGPGIFGAEAAAQHHFQKPASSLTAREAAQLAASLPNPFRRDAGDPGPQTARKAGIIQARMRIAGPVAECVLQSSGASTTKQRSD